MCLDVLQGEPVFEVRHDVAVDVVVASVLAKVIVAQQLDVVACSMFAGRVIDIPEGSLLRMWSSSGSWAREWCMCSACHGVVGNDIVHYVLQVA